MNILIIAGHGAGDCGAVGNGYKEADLTREFAKLLKTELDGYTNVTIADINRNWNDYLIEQGGFFDFTQYDYVIEIHFNSHPNKSANGVEVFITRSEKTNGVETEIVKGISDIGFYNRGVKRKNFDVIHYIKKQGVSPALLEVCFISNANDMNLYQAKKKEIAKATAEGIAKGFGLKRKNDELSEACKVLASKGIINSPDYWAKGEGYSNENITLLIKKFASYVKGESK